MLRRVTEHLGKIPQFRIIVLAHALYYLAYFLTNHLKVFKLHMLPFIGGEENIPLVNWTVIVYLSAAIMAPIAMFLIKQPQLGRVFVYGAGLVAVAMISFVVYPIAYPRPITDNFLLHLLHTTDSPSNCFPSLHVAASFYLSLCLWRFNSKRIGFLFLLWSAAITVSTLTTKQHYIIDIIASGILAVVFAWLATRKQTR